MNSVIKLPQLGSAGKILNRTGVMFGATLIGNVLVYAYSVVVGRALAPDEFGVVASILSLLLLMQVPAGIVQLIMAKYGSHSTATGGDWKLRRVLLQVSKWSFGVTSLVTFILILASRSLASFLHLPSPAPVILCAACLLPMITLAVGSGILQGLQRFWVLGGSVVLQAGGRFLIALLLLGLATGIDGAVAALPLSIGMACLWVFGYLFVRLPVEKAGLEVALSLPSLRYIVDTSVGLTAFALMTNMHLLLVKHFFAPAAAGDYSAAVTLGKIIFFFPLAVVTVMFPEAARRSTLGEETSSLLRMCLLIVGVLSVLLTIAYALFPSAILGMVFGPRYLSAVSFLGAYGLATTGYGLVNVWLRYYLSLGGGTYPYLLLGGALLQALGVVMFHSSLQQVVVVLLAVAFIMLLSAELLHRRPARHQILTSQVWSGDDRK